MSKFQCLEISLSAAMNDSPKEDVVFRIPLRVHHDDVLSVVTLVFEMVAKDNRASGYACRISPGGLDRMMGVHLYLDGRDTPSDHFYTVYVMAYGAYELSQNEARAAEYKALKPTTAYDLHTVIPAAFAAFHKLRLDRIAEIQADGIEQVAA